MYFKNGKFREFGFKENKTEDEIFENSGTNLFKIFRHYVKEYNSGKEPSDSICLRPGFFATRSGAVLLWLVGLLMVGAVILMATKNIKSIAFLLIGAGAYLPLLVKRKADKEFYNRVSKMDLDAVQ